MAVDTSVLDTIQPTGQQNTLVSDINNYTPQDLSPEQQQQFQQQYTPATGMLPTSAYYPDVNHNIGVGGYSGSEIGSTTLFAPGGGLVPLGMLDARDAAAQHAALKKQKDLEDFQKMYQSPTTKHVAVQKNLTEAYHGGLQQWNQNALKKAGGNQALAIQMLKQDPNFQNWNKSMQDTAKFHDAIVEHSAQLHTDELNPDFVNSPESRKANAELLNGIAYQGMDPFSKQGQDIGKKFLASQALYDLDKASNIAIDKAIPNIEQLPPSYVGRGKNEIATYLEKEYFKPEQIDQMARTVYNEKYAGTDIPYEAVKKSIESKLGEKIKRKTDTYDKYYKPDAKTEPEYDPNAVVSESGEKVVSRGDVVNSHTEHYVPANANDQKKELKFSIDKNMTAADGTPVNAGETGYVKGSVQGIGVKPFYKKEGRYLTDEEVAKLKERGVYNTTKDIVMKPAVIFNVASPKEETVDAEGNTISAPGEQKTIYFDTQKIANIFKGKGGKEQKDFEYMRQQTEKYAEEKNKDRGKEPEKSTKKKIAGF